MKERDGLPMNEDDASFFMKQVNRVPQRALWFHHCAGTGKLIWPGQRCIQLRTIFTKFGYNDLYVEWLTPEYNTYDLLRSKS